jgi:hypothetical protein
VNQQDNSHTRRGARINATYWPAALREAGREAIALSATAYVYLCSWECVCPSYIDSGSETALVQPRKSVMRLVETFAAGFVALSAQILVVATVLI